MVPQRRAGLAEGEGFEPPVALRLRLISSQVPSTTQPPFLPLLANTLHPYRAVRNFTRWLPPRKQSIAGRKVSSGLYFPRIHAGGKRIRRFFKGPGPLGRIRETLSVRYPEVISSQSPMVARNELPWVNIPQQKPKPKKEGGHSCPPCRPAGRGQECPLSVVRLWEVGIENGCKVASYSPHSQHGRHGTQPPAGLIFLLYPYPR